ncbi:MAG: response regulator [candidate division NC10 bacterium]|nr:response regulator [candidate division NC10 bacterium]
MRQKILLIDDSLRSRAAIKKAFEGSGFETIEGTSGLEAVRLVKETGPDVLFIAVGLPDLDGIEASARIMESHPLPIIILTSHQDPETVERAKEAGVMAYLLKPVREEQLRPAVEVASARFREFMALRVQNQDLTRTLEARKLTERAKGILMKREGLSESEAFRRLQNVSMERRKPMVEVAEAILLSEEVASRKRR